MSRTLKLIDHLLTRARHLEQLGQTTDALDLLSRLEGFPDLPIPTLTDIQVKLAEFYLEQRKYVRAARHLKTALKHEPTNARCHFLLATALSSGSKPDPQAALKHFHLALELDPHQPDCLAACGALEVRQGLKKEGLEHLRRASKLAVDDLNVMKQVVTGLRLANESSEARGLLLAARFRNPRSREVQQLWNDFYFRRARKHQQLGVARLTTRSKQEKPVILPFIRLTADEATPSPSHKTVRRDNSEKLPPPRGAFRLIRPDQRHAQ
ncbi:MAG: hypothetical protein ACJ8FY_04505 [Gemmataceae bacterium]